MSGFLNLLSLASQNRWCMKPYCTTCGASEFRTAIRQLGEKLADDLATMDLDFLEQAPEWEDGIRFALDALLRPDMKDKVFSAWLPNIDGHVRLADLVLFYYVRHGALFVQTSPDVLVQWRAKCIELASQTHNESLVESLIYTLGKRYTDYPKLESVIRELCSNSRPVALALQRQDSANLHNRPRSRC